jgi:Na+-driven multidrug efflux pump
LHLIGASGATFAHLDDYFSIVSIFMALAAGGTVLSGMMRSEGATNKAMTAMFIGIALNLILDPILILWHGNGGSGLGDSCGAGRLIHLRDGLPLFEKDAALR